MRCALRKVSDSVAKASCESTGRHASSGRIDRALRTARMVQTATTKLARLRQRALGVAGATGLRSDTHGLVVLGAGRS
jgi:hypothetical protein